MKPSNVLINREGHVKMCDFGISGYLVDSVAKTMDAGCKPYMAVSGACLAVLGELYHWGWDRASATMFSAQRSPASLLLVPQNTPFGYRVP